MAIRVITEQEVTAGETELRTSHADHADAEAPPYRWLVLAAAFMIMLASAGIGQAFSLFVKPIAADFGGARGSIAIAYTLYMICFGVGSFVMTWLADRIRMRWLLLLGVISYTVGAVLVAVAESLWMLYLAFGVLNGGAVGSLVGCLTYTVAQWFAVRKGLALGILLAGMGMGVFASSMTATFVMDVYGWRGTFLALGSLAFLINLPAVLLVRERGRAKMPDALRQAPQAGSGAGWTTASAMKTGSFWSLNTTFFCCCVCHSVPLLHIIPYASDLGLSASRSALMITFMGLSSVVGRTGVGALSDWIGGKRTLFMCLILQTLCVAWALTFTSWAAWITFAIVFGISQGGVFPLYPAITRGYFGAEGTGGIYGFQLLLSTLGMGLGAYAGGHLYDLFGTYRASFLTSIAVGALSVLLLLTVRAPRLKAASGR